jgi:hypothetical protein
LIGDSSLSVEVNKSLFDLLGRFAYKATDILFDDESVESFYSLVMINSSDEIDLNHNGGLNRHDEGDEVEDNTAAPLDIIVGTRNMKVHQYLQEFGSASKATLNDKTNAKSEQSLSRGADDASIPTKKIVSNLLGLRPEKRSNHPSQRLQQQPLKEAAERVSRQKAGTTQMARKPLPSTESRFKKSLGSKKVRQPGEDASVSTKEMVSSLLGLRLGKRLNHPSRGLQPRPLNEAAERVPRQKSGNAQIALQSIPSTESCFWD